jgi:hypothetical protein
MVRTSTTAGAERSYNYYQTNRVQINKRKCLTKISEGVVPYISTMVGWGITYEEFAESRAFGGLSPIEEKTFRKKAANLSAEDFKKFFGIDKPLIRTVAKNITEKDVPPPPKEMKIDPVIPLNSKADYTYENALASLTAAVQQGKLKDDTVRSYRGNLNKLLRVLDVIPGYVKTKEAKERVSTINLIDALSKYSMDKLQKLLDEQVGVNSRKDIFGMINNLYKHFPGFKEALQRAGVDQDQTRATRNNYSTDSTEYRLKQADTETVTHFTKFLNKVKDWEVKEKGEAPSTEHVIGALFTKIPARRQTDYIPLMITKINDYRPGGNYININNGLMVIDDFKTRKKLGTYKVTLPDSLLKLITEYWLAEGKPKYLFGSDKPISAQNFNKHFVNAFKGVLKPKQGVREIRRSTRTYYVKDRKYGVQQQYELARAMGHGLGMSVTYGRQYGDEFVDDEDVEEVEQPPTKKSKTIQGMKVHKYDKDEEYVPRVTRSSTRKRK